MRRSPSERFWEKVEKTGSCWLWAGARSPQGYGVFRLDGRAQRAHRVSWMMLLGPIPDGMEVCHDCPEGDNPACVRPDHCFLAPHQANMADMSRKGRSPIGERQGASKLSASDVGAIRERAAAGETQAALAAVFGVRQGHIGRIVRGEEWAHLPVLTGRHRAKLDAEQVAALRAQRAAGASLRDLAARFGVGTKHVWRIATGESWPE